ncbi:MAG: hypothetical protein AMXMBFR49_25260 [Chlorobiota bacterium]
MATYTLIVCRFGVEIGSMTPGTLHSDVLPSKLKTGFIVIKAVKLHIPEVVRGMAVGAIISEFAVVDIFMAIGA